MSAAEPWGPQLPDHENVLRAILTDFHWIPELGMPSSAAFSMQVFSVDVDSRTTPQKTRNRFRSVLGLVKFNCGDAKLSGYDPRDEIDPKVPDNDAHAHVYMIGYYDLTNSKRKAKARMLLEKCICIE